VIFHIVGIFTVAKGCKFSLYAFKFIGIITTIIIIYTFVSMHISAVRVIFRHFSTLSVSLLLTKVACGSVWVRNLVSDVKGGTQTEGV
jgi:hypothetical protein